MSWRWLKKVTSVCGLLFASGLWCLAQTPPQAAGGIKTDAGESKTGLKGTIFLYCAAGMRLPVDALAKEFQAKTGVQIQSSYDGTNKLLGQIELTRKGDVYIAGDADYVAMAREKGFIAEARDIAFFVPVIMVKKGNPLGIRTLSDCLKPNVRIGQGDPKSAAVGRIMPRLLELNGVDPAQWAKNVVLSTPTVNELGNAMKLGTLDVAVVWDAIAAAYKECCDWVAIEVSKNIMPVIEAATLSFSENPEAGKAFLAFLASDRGKEVLKASGYSIQKPL